MSTTSLELLQLLKYPEHDPPAYEGPETFQLINDALVQSVNNGDEVESKELWKCKTIARIQQDFVLAFGKLKAGAFYEAWCLFERCEVESASLFRHYSPSAGDPHRMDFVRIMTERWQSLFPYRLFFSPEYIKREVVCSICRSPIKPRTGCNHVVGEIYNGERCLREVTKAEVLSISLVENPVQKYSVVFKATNESTGPKDHYDYTVLRFVVDRVAAAFDAWEPHKTSRTITANDVARLRSTDRCPCASGKQFGDCCLGKSELTIPHIEIVFAVPPKGDLPALVLPF